MLGLVPQGTPVDRIVPWAVTIDDGHPAAWLEVFYRAARAQMGAAGGHLKMAISARADHPLLCFHDEIGYRDSFRRVAQGFFESFEPAQRAAEPKYLDVMIRYAEDVPIGFKKLPEFGGGLRDERRRQPRLRRERCATSATREVRCPR
jgi:hypothetical protein